MDTKSNAMPVNTLESGMELKEGEEKDLLVRCKRTKFSASTVQLQPRQGVEVSDMENKVPDVLLHKVSAGKDPMNKHIYSAVQGNNDANSHIKGHAHGNLFFFTGNQSARSRLRKFCTASGWKEPLYYFEEQGPPHKKLFKCKVTVYVEGISNTILECLGDQKRQKKAAQEHAAQGAMWCLAHIVHAK